MSSQENVYEVPEGLPEPEDDGACDHLPGMRMPSVSLRSTAGDPVDLSTLTGTTGVWAAPRDTAVRPASGTSTAATERATASRVSPR